MSALTGAEAQQYKKNNYSRGNTAVFCGRGMLFRNGPHIVGRAAGLWFGRRTAVGGGFVFFFTFFSRAAGPCREGVAIGIGQGIVHSSVHGIYSGFLLNLYDTRRVFMSVLCLGTIFFLFYVLWLTL